MRQDRAQWLRAFKLSSSSFFDERPFDVPQPVPCISVPRDARVKDAMHSMHCTKLRSLQYIQRRIGADAEVGERLMAVDGGGRMGGEERAAPRGYVPVLVGAAAAEEGLQRFLVSVEAFKHACFVSLLEMAAGEFGYQQKGVLRIPCDPEHFRRVLKMPIKGRKRVFEAVSEPVG